MEHRELMPHPVRLKISLLHLIYWRTSLHLKLNCGGIMMVWMARVIVGSSHFR
jgi:hypothetical protein